MYCPQCKNFNDVDFDPMENIKQFIKFVEQEEKKWEKYLARRRAIKSKSPAKKQFNQPNHRKAGLENDSASDITELDKKEILTKYYEEVMTAAEKHNKERKLAQERLYNKKKVKACFDCKNPVRGRPQSQGKQIVKLEMREAKDILMLDEEHSAHQFSLHDRSMQADSEERLDQNNQTCLFDMKSMQG